MPKVSVIIPTHNRAQFLRSAIGSVLKQTYQDFEIIVVDDASDDNTQEVVTSFDGWHIKYVRHEVNKGDAGSRNTGILISTGRYVAFLDDDDEWLPEKLQAQVGLLEASPAKVGGVYTGLFKVNKTTGKIVAISIPEKRGDLFQEMFIESPIVTSCVVLRRQCFDKVGLFDEQIPYNNDYDMWIRIAEQFHFECISEPLVVYHTHEQKLSTNPTLVVQGHQIVLQKYKTFIVSNRKSYSRLCYSLGILYCLAGHREKSKKAFFSSIELAPFEVKYYLALLVSFFGPNALRKLLELNERVNSAARDKKTNQELKRLAARSLLPTVRSMCRSGLAAKYTMREICGGSVAGNVRDIL
jgi:glycosyltransferase involved in cell wall biosynthesis